MKNIKFSILSILIILGISCQDKLELTPISQLSEPNFYQSETDYIIAINGAYNGLRSEFGDIVLFGDIRSDNTIPVLSGTVTTRTDFNDFSILPNNIAIREQWENSYNTISRANAILDRIDDAAIADNLKSQIKGEALFIRGLVYFNLVRIFGYTPLVINQITPAASLELPQSSPDQIYSQIIKDVAQAGNLLPVTYDAANIGRATSIAAKALLGKVHLYNKNYDEAESAFRSVMNEEGTNVGLLSDYSKVFSIDNEYNSEIIFAVRWSNDGVNGNSFNYAYANINEPDNKATTTDLFREFEAGDLRRDFTLNTQVSTIDTVIYKYGYAPTGQGESDWPVIRYADVLLMMSEVLNEQTFVAGGEAFNLLNRVRKRAGLDPLVLAEVNNREAFRLAIEHERRCELASEGHRWFDLVRTGRYVEVMTAKGFNVEEHHDLFPIPENEILKVNDNSILKQNTGY